MPADKTGSISKIVFCVSGLFFMVLVVLWLFHIYLVFLAVYFILFLLTLTTGVILFVRFVMNRIAKTSGFRKNLLEVTLVVVPILSVCISVFAVLLGGVLLFFSQRELVASPYRGRGVLIERVSGSPNVINVYPTYGWFFICEQEEDINPVMVSAEEFFEVEIEWISKEEAHVRLPGYTQGEECFLIRYNEWVFI